MASKNSENEPPKINHEALVQDEMIMKQKEAIEKEIQASHSLVSGPENIQALEKQFANDATFLQNAVKLQKNYKFLR